MKIVNLQEIRNEHNVTLAVITLAGGVKFPYPSTEYSVEDLWKILKLIKKEPHEPQPGDRE
jgi:diaminopimelate decarboxylase